MHRKATPIGAARVTLGHAPVTDRRTDEPTNSQRFGSCNLPILAEPRRNGCARTCTARSLDSRESVALLGCGEPPTEARGGAAGRDARPAGIRASERGCVARTARDACDRQGCGSSGSGAPTRLGRRVRNFFKARRAAKFDTDNRILPRSSASRRRYRARRPFEGRTCRCWLR
jgi:hypothetical protein